MFDVFLKQYEKYVLDLKNNLFSVDHDLFNSIDSHLNLYNGFIPRNNLEKTLYTIGVIILIPIAAILPLVLIFPIFPFLNKYIQPGYNLIIFLLGLIWFLTYYISLMVIFMAVGLVFYSIFLLYFENLFSSKLISFKYYLAFSWYYTNFLLYEFLNIILHFKTLLPIVLVILAEIIGVIIGDLIVFFVFRGI